MNKVIFCLILPIFVILLTACHNIVIITDYQLVGKAIALEIQLTQQKIYPNSTAPPNFTVEQVHINQVKSLKIQDLPSVKIQGTYNLNLQLPSHRIRQKNQNFTVYIQSQKEGKTWRLARPVNNQTQWLTYLINDVN